MAKIVLIGAGSQFFSRRVIPDILWYPELRDGTIILMDINKEQLDCIVAFAMKMVEQHGLKTKIESTTDRREALEGADYVIVTIKVGCGNMAWVESAREIPARYRAEGDGQSMGPGGIFYGLHHIPVIIDICRDMEELCPDAWLINYTNPMAMVCWAVNDYTSIKNVGLCHSVQTTSNELARYLGIPYKDLDLPKGSNTLDFGSQFHEEFTELSYWVAGINHMAWFLELKWRGEDAYPLLREKFKDPNIYSDPAANWAGPDVVRAEIFKAFGYFNTEASQIVGYYFPYFKKINRPELIYKFGLEWSRETMAQERMKQEVEFNQYLSSGLKLPIIHSNEYSSVIIHSIETGKSSRINGNVKNNGLITNLPQGCCVEVPCLVDKEGIHPCYIGDLPPQCAALNRTNINVQELAVRGIMEKDKTKLFQAILLDPLTAAILTIDEIRQMVDELFLAEKEYLKGFK